MDTTPSATRESQPRATSRRRWLRFSLRTFLIVCILLAIAFGWLGSILVRVRHQRAIVAELETAGAILLYEDSNEESWWPGAWMLRPIIGDEVTRDVVGVLFPHGHVSDAQLARLVKLPHLRYVSAPGEDIAGEVITDAGIEHVARVKELEHLSLTTDTPLSGRALARLSDAKELRELFLGGSGITNETVESIDELNSLTKLHLTDTRVAGAGLEPLSRLTALEELSLFRSRGVQDDGIHHIASLPNLGTLDLEGCGVSDAGMEYVATLPKLRVLHLAETNVGDRGAAALAGLDRLEELGLRNTAVTNEATVHLGKLKRLRQLSLYGTGVTDEGLLSLRELVELEILLLGPSVTAEAAGELKAFLPKCRIEGLDPGGVNAFVIPAE